MNARRRNSCLKGVMINGAWIEEPTRVKEVVRSFFIERFQEPDPERPRLDGQKYPRLYLISSQQNHTIQQMGVHNDSGWEWQFTWRRLLFDNEIDMATEFLKDIETQQIQPQRSDGWAWMADSNGQFLAKSAYIVMRESSSEAIKDTTFADLWKMKVPHKILVFAWRLLRDRLPTRSNLHRRQVVINDRRCLLCGNMEEDTGHLFFHCSKVIPLWWESLSWVTSVGPLPQNPKQHFLQHIHGVTQGARSKRWRWWWLALTWLIWQQGNKILFSNDSFDANKIMEDASFLLWTWLRHLEKDFNISYNHWSNNLSSGFVY